MRPNFSEIKDREMPQSATELFEEFKGEFKAFTAANDQVISELKSTVDELSTEQVAKITTALTNIENLTANLQEIEQKVADSIQDGTQFPAQTVGEMVIASDAYKKLALNPGDTPENGTKLHVEANTITGQSGGDSDSTLVPADRKPGIIPGTFRMLRVRDLLTKVPTTSNAYEFTKEDTFVNNAAETAETAAKPETDLTFVPDNVHVRTIAHWITVSNQILADAPALKTYIDRRMMYGVELREEKQIVAGNGTGQNISGMTATGNFAAFTPTASETEIDGVNRAKEAIILGEYTPTGVLMNPADWFAIERLKTTDTAYLVGNPFGSITPILWGLPVVLSTSMAAGKFLVADFAGAYDLVERQSTVVEVGYKNDDFTKNLMTIRAEKRSALATLLPSAVRYGDLKAA